MSALCLYTVAILLWFFFLNVPRSTYMLRKFIIQCFRFYIYICVVGEVEKRERKYWNSPKKNYKNPKKCIIIFLFKLCFSINVLSSAKQRFISSSNSNLYPVLTIGYIQFYDNSYPVLTVSYIQLDNNSYLISTAICIQSQW